MTTGVSVSPERLVDDPPLIRARWWEVTVIFLIALAILWALIAWFDNVHRATTNGLWKSIDVNTWLTPGGRRHTDGGNLLYFPGLAKGVVLMRKYAACYAQGRAGARAFRTQVAGARNRQEFVEVVEQFFPRDP